MKSFYITVVTAAALLVLLRATPSAGLRILGIFPGNRKSYFVMCETLMKGLVERGHQVDVYSNYPLENPPANYTDYVLEYILPEVLDNLTYDSIYDLHIPFSYYMWFGKSGLPICKLLKMPTFQKLLKNPPKDPPYDLVIVEPFLSNCYLAWGRHLNVPMIVVSTSNLFDWVHGPLSNPFNSAIHPSYTSSFVAPMDFNERMKNVITSMISTIFFNHFVREQDRVIRDAFGKGYPTAKDLYKDVSLMLVNYNQVFSGIRPFIPMVVPVGGLHIVDDNESLTREVQDFLDESKQGFVFMSFGSMLNIETLPKPTLEAFYAAFMKIAPIRVLLQIADPSELPTGLPSNVLTHNRLPQIKVLKHQHIKAFITQGELMSIQEAVYFGVPMLGIPLFPEHYFNMKSCEKKEVAITLVVDDITEETLSRALIKILGSPSYKKKAVRMSKLLQDVPQSPMDIAIYWIEYVHRHGKSALRPADFDIAWWQIAALDVYVVTLFLIVSVSAVTILGFILLIILCRASATKLIMKFKSD